MNPWTQLSVEYANQRNYLDELFRVYPTVPEGIRDIETDAWERVEGAFRSSDKSALVEELLSLELFPIKDSYVAYLKRDRTALERNPNTIERLGSMLMDLGLNELYKRSSQPKETNRQIGPLFRRWLEKETLGLKLYGAEELCRKGVNGVLAGSDKTLRDFAVEHLSYSGQKGLDFVAKVNEHYVVGEAKFLTDFGGHQNAQFEDAKKVLEDQEIRATTVAILDGVLYIQGKGKMYRHLLEHPEQNIVSALVLREFLWQL